MQIKIDDLLNDPKKFGLPTFEEFAKNPDQWRKAADEALCLAEKGSQLEGLRKLVVKKTYQVAGYKCDTLEEAERVALNEGWDLRMMDMQPHIVPLGGGKCNIHIVFVNKQTKEQVVDEAVRKLKT